MTKLHLIMPMGGRGSRFFKNGFVQPKPLIEINGHPFFYWSIQSILKFIDVADLICVVLQEHIDEFQIDKKITSYYPNAKIIVIPHVLDGAVLTCMAGVEQTADDYPILFNDCDHAFKCVAFNQFCQRGNFNLMDGALLTFKSNENKYSYAQFDENQNVIHTVEKQVVSNSAICGAYYFKNKEVFLSSAKEYLTKCNYAEFFMSGVYNIMAERKQIIKNFETDIHVSFGTPDEYIEAQKNTFLSQEELG